MLLGRVGHSLAQLRPSKSYGCVHARRSASAASSLAALRLLWCPTQDVAACTLAISRTVCAVVEGHRSEPGMGRNYSREFRAWIKRHGFDKMPAATRSVAVELLEHAEAITSWRDGLPERQRRRLIHPLSVTRRWRASQRTATAGAHRETYGATPSKRGLVSVPARRHCRRVRPRRSGDS